MEELRKEFEESYFFNKTVYAQAKPYLYFFDGEYKAPIEFISLVIRINSAWFMFQELKKKQQ